MKLPCCEIPICCLQSNFVVFYCFLHSLFSVQWPKWGVGVTMVYWKEKTDWYLVLGSCCWDAFTPSYNFHHIWLVFPAPDHIFKELIIAHNQLTVHMVRVLLLPKVKFLSHLVIHIKLFELQIICVLHGFDILVWFI